LLSAAKVEAILREKSHEIKPLEEMKWKGREKKREKRQEEFQHQCEEAIYGGTNRDGEKGATRVGAGHYVKDGGRTEAVVGGGEAKRPSVMVEGTAALEAELGPREWPEEEERRLVDELRRQWIEASAQLRQEGKETVGGVDLADLELRLKLAFPVVGEGEAGSEESEVVAPVSPPATGNQAETESVVGAVSPPPSGHSAPSGAADRTSSPPLLTSGVRQAAVRTPPLQLPTCAKSPPPPGTGSGSWNGGRGGSAGR
jgi:hypothetical protein